jgi:hypothetical protein
MASALLPYNKHMVELSTPPENDINFFISTAF